MKSELSDRFKLAMWDIYKCAKTEVGYNALRYLHMLDKYGEIQTAHILINSPTVSEGYAALWALGRLDLTVEALIFDHPEYYQLFSKDEMIKIKKRLVEYNYAPALVKL